MRGLISDFTVSQWEECKAFFENRCAYCGEKSKTLTMEHIIPVYKGGGFTAKNIIPSCGSCNYSKCNKDLEEWYRQQKFFEEEKLKKIYSWINRF